MINLENFTCEGYENVEYRHLSDIDTEGLVLRHTKSGARLVLLSNDDRNKVFAVAFRTTPKNSTGVPHILEHSVLSGSDKYPVKDPFTELSKGSLKTFLNAFTGPDTTVYPCASCNDKDFRNLVDVYMDAVMHPIIYKRKGIFLQEGWRYELENPEDELTLNGVVYSEMKGVYSDPESSLDFELRRALYPDVTYGVESGGDPDVIPELSYEEFLEFHRTYYSPSNSYIYLYGDMDMAEMLTYLDREYLSAFERVSVDSEIGLQKPTGFTRRQISYSITDGEDTADKTFLEYGVKVYDGPDVKLAIAWNILSDLLFSMPGAPVKKALLDAGIGNDVSGYILSDMRQPMVAVTARETEADRADEFLAIIRDTVAQVIREGVNKKSVLAMLNRAEFGYREADFGGYPKGLMFSLTALENYIYDERFAFDGLDKAWVFDELRRELDNGYFEKLLQQFLDTDHAALVVMTPEKGLAARKEQELAEQLAAKKASMSDDEIAALVRQTRELKAEQEREETEEEKACIPLLSRADLGAKQTEPQCTCGETANGIPTVVAEDYNKGLTYIGLRFRVTDLPQEEIPYLGLLSDCLGRMDTDNYSYSELQDEINYYTGEFDFNEGMTSTAGEIGRFTALYLADGRIFDDRIDDYLRLLREVLCTTKFNDADRLREIINEGAARLPSHLESSGNNTAVNHLEETYDSAALFTSLTKSLGYYRALRGWKDNFDACKDEIAEHLSRVRSFVFTKERALIGLSASPATVEKTVEKLASIEDIFRDIPAPQVPIVPAEKNPWEGGYELRHGNEALTYAGAVQYAAVGGNIRREGYTGNGDMLVLRTILNKDYLWTKVRVLGGAYGVFMSIGMVSGNLSIASYRDPNLRETYDVFNGIPDYIDNLALSEKELTRYVIGTIAALDMPYTAPTALRAVLSRRYSGMTQEMMQGYRDDVLTVDLDRIRRLAPMLRSVLAQGYRSAVSSESKAAECADLFDSLASIR